MSKTLKIDSLLSWSARWLWVIPVSTVLSLQIFGVTINWNAVLSFFPISDPSGWLACASAFPFGVSWADLWCLRRPVAIFALSPIGMVANFGVEVAVILNTMLVALSFTVLARELHQSRVSLHANLFFQLASIPLAINYGLYLGPAAVAIALNALAFAALLRYLRLRRTLDLTIGPFLCSVAFLARPATPALLFIMIAVFAWLILKSKLSAPKKAGVIFVWASPFGFSPLLRILGWTEAGHGANSAATLYSLVSEDAASWPAVYEKYSIIAPGVPGDSFEWKELVTRDAIANFTENPAIAFGRFQENLVEILSRGYLNLLYSAPRPPSSWDFGAFVQELIDGRASAWQGLVASALWSLSTVAIIFSMVFLVILGFKLIVNPSRVRGSTLGANIVGPLVASVSTLGTVIFFGLVGHDESVRHLAPTFPMLAGFLLFSRQWIRGGPEEIQGVGVVDFLERDRSSRVRPIAAGFFVIISFVFSSGGSKVLVLDSCLPASRDHGVEWQVIAIADVEAIFTGEKRNWVDENFENLGTGVVFLGKAGGPWGKVEKFYVPAIPSDLSQPLESEMSQFCRSDSNSVTSALGLSPLQKVLNSMNGGNY